MADLPDRFARAIELRGALTQRGIYFAPIRHHSPACALAVRALINDLSPAGVLIEGPAEYDQLLPALAHPETSPPVAILSLSTGEDAASSFFPLADFSPEWVALREAAAAKTPVAFIDESWDAIAKQDADSDFAATRRLQNERYFAQSRTLAALARQEHCRDHDELWEHLFELPEPQHSHNWSKLFEEVFAWSALARLDYEPEVLIAEGSISREAAMAKNILTWRERVTGPLVVVTGAFHTLALIETLGSALGLRGGTAHKSADPAAIILARMPKGAGPAKKTAANSWLIRYDLTRLDAYSGYGAGIRSPGYYQRYWQTLTTAQPTMTTDFLVDIARLANQADTYDLISTAEIVEASLQAERLAALRSHPRPGRTDLLDACTSVFANGEVPLPPAIRDAIAEVFGGSRLGVLPPGVAAPPIIAEARGLAEKLRFNVSDSSQRKTQLDVRRSATARARSRFLALMTFLGSGFASKIAGPDYLAGRNLGRMSEEWDYAWTPMVEARLIGLIEEGATLNEAARHRLRASERNLDSTIQNRSSQAVVQLAAQAALIGMDDELARLAKRLDQMIEQDPGLVSVLQAALGLMRLWRARELLDLAEPDQLVELVNRALPQLAYLIDENANCKPEGEAGIVRALVEVKELARELSETTEIDPAAISEALSQLRTRMDVSPGILGAAIALGTAAGEIDDAETSDRIQAVFAPGGDQRYAMRFLAGLMQSAPDLLLYTPQLFDAVDASIAALEQSAFLEYLPELRRAFSWLKPLETAQVAERVAKRTGFAAASIQTSSATLTEADLHLGLAIEQQLRASLIRDGLHWLIPDSAHTAIAASWPESPRGHPAAKAASQVLGGEDRGGEGRNTAASAQVIHD